MAGYQIFTDATADFNVQSIQTPPFVHIIPMQLTIGGETYTYGPGGTIDTREFYAMQRAGAYAATTQIAPDTYFRHFEPALRAGLDILYLGFSSAMSGTFQTARLCARELREQYPGRKIVCVDTRCASVGEGLLVCEAARRQAEGYSLEQLANWAACSSAISATGSRWMFWTICGMAGGFLPLRQPSALPCRSSRCCMWIRTEGLPFWKNRAAANRPFGPS